LTGTQNQKPFLQHFCKYCFGNEYEYNPPKHSESLFYAKDFCI
jgi:hypothetical protein